MASPYALDFSPMTNALAQYRQGTDVADQYAQYRNALANAGAMPGVTPGMVGLVGALDPGQGVNALFSASNAAQGRAQAQAQLAEQIRQHNSTIALQQQQLRIQQQAEARQSALTPYDIKIREAEAANKQMDTDLMRGLVGGGQPVAPSAPMPPSPPNALDSRGMPGQAPPLPPMRGPAPLSQQNVPRSPLPLPGERPMLQPQSGDGFDPSMVRPIADTPQGQAAPQQAAPQTINTPFGQMTPDRAQQMAGILALRGKNEAAKLMEKAIEKSGLSKEPMSKVEDKMVGMINDLGELRQIAKQYSPQFQTLKGRVNMAAKDMQSWIAPSTLGDDDKQQLMKFHEFRATAYNRLNSQIKDLSGSAVSGSEEQRMLRANPDPGTSWWNGDSPPAFEAKMMGAAKLRTAAIARYNMLRTQGLTPEAIASAATNGQIEKMAGLDDISKIVNKRSDDLARKISQDNPGVGPGAIDLAVKNQIKKEFGI